MPASESGATTRSVCYDNGAPISSARDHIQIRSGPMFMHARLQDLAFISNDIFALPASPRKCNRAARRQSKRVNQDTSRTVLTRHTVDGS